LAISRRFDNSSQNVRRPGRFKQADLRRALNAVRAAGLDVARTEIASDGHIVLVHATSAGAPATITPYEAWRAAHGSR
jgi:hypothetical protein